MSAPIFPQHIRTIDEVPDFLTKWVEALAGELRDDLQVRTAAKAGRGLAYLLGPVQVVFPHAGTTLTVTMALTATLEAAKYAFDFRNLDGTLIFREDNHAGHEADLGSRYHRHVPPGETTRLPSAPVTLETIAQQIVSWHINRP